MFMLSERLVREERHMRYEQEVPGFILRAYFTIRGGPGSRHGCHSTVMEVCQYLWTEQMETLQTRATLWSKLSA